MVEPSSRFRGRRGLFVFAIVVGLFASCGGLVYLVERPINGIRVERLEADLNERLPDGCTWDQAEAWFASHGIKPFGIHSAPDDQRVGLGAMVPNDTLLWPGEIRIFLHFSPEGKLKERIIYRYDFPL